MTPERQFKELGLVFPPASAPAGNYATAVRTGNLLYLSGKAPSPVGGKAPKVVPLTLKAIVEVKP